ncbi:MAG: DeoR/GlpR transcriptional regulator [Clostridia bacterium]|nr:DeoR/GlpR transcriptional regulator [Clostridia bacterium]
MMIGERHEKILEALRREPNITVAKLSTLLNVSEPTIRRDLTELHNKGIITKIYGGAIINEGYADREIPFFFRENEQSSVKTLMGKKASTFIEDGMVIMLDGSTSAYHIVPYLKKFKDIIVITSGAKTALALAESNIKTFCTGGQMLIHSFSYVGEHAERFVSRINADLLFFSCRGLSNDGQLTEVAIEEADIRRAMFKSSKKRILLCDSSKFGKRFFYNMGDLAEIDEVISDKPLPEELMKRITK